MRPTTILTFSAGLLVACARGGSSEQRATPGAGDPARAEARSSATGQPDAEHVPFGPRSEQRRGQDSVLRTSGVHKRLKAPSDST